jgi:uncharacterized iron-regulated membrane protein
VRTIAETKRVIGWQQWLHRPERLWVRNAVFQVHLWVGAAVGLYVVLMSISGSMIVYRNELSLRFSIEWIVNLHKNLLLGSTGRLLNGVGAVCLTSLCLTGALYGGRESRTGAAVSP